jgi:outer membrane protein TolC
VALRDVAVAERAGQVNKLLFAAAKDYAAWYEAWRRLGIADEGVELAEFRYGATMRRFDDGDAAAIDTVEAGLELQRRLVARLEAANDWFVTTQVVNTYLWSENAVPFDLAPGVVPTLAGVERTPLDTVAADGWLARSVAQHPDLLKALAKQRAAEADRRLYGQELLPAIRVEAGALKDAALPYFESWGNVSENYKYGIEAKSSLLLLKERGMLGAAGAKLESARLEATLVQRELRAAVFASANDVLTFERILDVQASAVHQSRLLRDGENRRFDEGESTLFLVNQRDRLLLDEQVKLAAFEAKYLGARAALAVALGGTLGDGRGLVPAEAAPR